VDFLQKLNISFDDVFVDPDRGGEKTNRPKFVPPVYLLDPALKIELNDFQAGLGTLGITESLR
ncbi:MAG: hypothetical protein M3255_11115, partial [Pseudomonadota bacterium]|nr:hypothetical protein [Pseudomonadota bacterium]